MRDKNMIEKETVLSQSHSYRHKIHLFCVPNAGGTALMYKGWKALLHPSIHLYLLELAGRGRRFQEDCYNDISEAVEDLYCRIEPQLGEGDFAFFGHSMGALLCYELIGKIWSRRHLSPLHAFLSGRLPPSNHEATSLPLQSDEQLRIEVMQWGGLSAQQLMDETLMRMFLPILRADLRVVETYNQRDREYHRLPCSLSILTGADDAIARPSEMSPWTEFTSQSCAFHIFPGGHFYITECKDDVIYLVNTLLAQL
jgi:medium-chain acyl-[acyl-carrier-protein] hydrolase